MYSFRSRDRFRKRPHRLMDPELKEVIKFAMKLKIGLEFSNLDQFVFLSDGLKKALITYNKLMRENGPFKITEPFRRVLETEGTINETL